MLANKRARLSKNASIHTISEADEPISILAVSKNDLALLHVLNNLINYSINGFQNIKSYILIYIGFIVTIYSLNQIEVKLNFFISYFSKFSLFNLQIMVLLVIILLLIKKFCFHSNSILKSFKLNESNSDKTNLIKSQVQILVNNIKRSENLIQICLIVLITICVLIFFVQISSISNLNRKLALRKQIPQLTSQTQLEVNVTENFTEKFVSEKANASSLSLIINSTEYEKNRILYDELYDKINNFRKKLPKRAIANKKCKALIMQNLIKSTKDLPICKIKFSRNLVDNRKKNNYIIFQKFETIWQKTFLIVLFLYASLLTVYFILGFIKIGVKSYNLTYKIESTDLKNDNLISNNKSIEYEYQSNQHQNQLYQKNKSSSIKKKSSQVSIKSENIKAVKLLQKAQKRNSECSDDVKIENSNDFEPLKWLINENYRELAEQLKINFQNSINECIVTGVRNFQYFIIFSHLQLNNIL
jgi:hypothetical protein